MTKYVALICARNEEAYIASCLSSLYFQTVPPELVVVVDDGSEDYTILRAFQFIGKLRITILEHPDRGFNAVGTPGMADPYNFGLEHLRIRKLEWDYILILGADTSIPPQYVAELTSLITPDQGTVSGRYPGIREDYAAATGRLIRREIIHGLDWALPRNYAWESSITQCTKFMGYQVASYPIPIYNLRPPGQRKRWGALIRGRTTRDRGDILLYALRKTFKYMLRGDILMGLGMLLGYLTYRPGEPLTPWALHNKNAQKKKVKERIKELLTRAWEGTL